MPTIFPIQAHAQGVLVPSGVEALSLPAPGTMVPLSPVFAPALIKGIRVFPDNPLRFDFFIDTGESGLKDEALKEESTKLIKYFLASVTVPEKDMWVNLSPYEKNRIIPDNFGKTEMGRDLLALDYLLKQITASLMYPEDDLGKKFWDRVYQKANDLYGTSEIPVNTFNKVWILPEKAIVYENGNSVFVAESRLKVMLEEDYVAMSHQKDIAESRPPRRFAAEAAGRGAPARGLALEHNSLNSEIGTDHLAKTDVEQLNDVSSSIVREIIIPELEKEVNEGKNFANLRQIYNSMILATWYKRALKESVLGKVYVDQNKTEGVAISDQKVNQEIYQRYLEAFEKGVYDYIKEDYDEATQEVIARKYFSGGVTLDPSEAYGKKETTVGIHPEGPIVQASVELNPSYDEAMVSKQVEFNIKASMVFEDENEMRVYQPQGITAEKYAPIAKKSQMQSAENFFGYRGMRVTREALYAIMKKGLTKKPTEIRQSFTDNPAFAINYAFEPSHWGEGYSHQNFLSVVFYVKNGRFRWPKSTEGFYDVIEIEEDIPIGDIHAVWVYDKSLGRFVKVLEGLVGSGIHERNVNLVAWASRLRRLWDRVNPFKRDDIDSEKEMVEIRIAIAGTSETFELDFVNRGDPSSYFWREDEKIILQHEVGYLTSIIEQLALQEVTRGAASGSQKIIVENLADTGASRVFLVRWGNKRYIIKRSTGVLYNKYIDNQWDVLQRINPAGSNADIAQPLMRGLSDITYSTDRSDKISYLVTNYFEGQDLYQQVTTRGKFDRQSVIDFGLKLAKLVKLVHQKGVIIRELKPQNIMIRKNGTVALYDFNVSMMPDYDWDKDPYDFKTTVKHGYADDGWEYFTRPRERNKPDVMSDVFTIGMDLFLAATGEEYYQGEHREKIGLEKLGDESLRRIIGRAIAPRGSRYNNVDELIADLEGLRVGESQDSQRKEDQAMLSGGGDAKATMRAEKTNYAGRYDPLLSWLDENDYFRIRDLEPSAVVDIGTSFGYGALDLARKLGNQNPGLKVYGVDPGEHVGLVRENEEMPGNLTFIQDDHLLKGTDRPQEPIMLMTVFNLLRNTGSQGKSLMIQEMAENLAENGLLILGDGGKDIAYGLIFHIFQKKQGRLVPTEMVLNRFGSIHNTIHFDFEADYFPGPFQDRFREEFKQWTGKFNEIITAELIAFNDDPKRRMDHNAAEGLHQQVFEKQLAFLKNKGVKYRTLSNGFVSFPLAQFMDQSSLTDENLGQSVNIRFDSEQLDFWYREYDKLMQSLSEVGTIIEIAHGGSNVQYSDVRKGGFKGRYITIDKTPNARNYFSKDVEYDLPQFQEFDVLDAQRIKVALEDDKNTAQRVLISREAIRSLGTDNPTLASIMGQYEVDLQIHLYPGEIDENLELSRKMQGRGWVPVIISVGVQEVAWIFIRKGRSLPQDFIGWVKDMIDSAMSSTEGNPGGIDFNPNNLDLQIRGKRAEFTIPLDPAIQEPQFINGFTPVIIQMIPVTHFPSLLMSESEKPRELQHLSQIP